MKRAINALLLILSAVLLGDAASGLLGPREPPAADEGTQAHIFQISVALIVPTMLAALATTRSLRAAWPLAIALVSLIVSFGAVYAIEHP